MPRKKRIKINALTLRAALEAEKYDVIREYLEHIEKLPTAIQKISAQQFLIKQLYPVPKTVEPDDDDTEDIDFDDESLAQELERIDR